MSTVKIEIKSRWDSSKVLFSADVSTEIDDQFRMRAAVVMAFEAYANLAYAYLAGANLAGAKISAPLTLIGKRPFFFLGPIGSESRVFHAYITNEGLRLRAGCFFGTRDEFLEKLADTHGSNEHADEYNAALAVIDKHVELWTPAEEQAEAA